MKYQGLKVTYTDEHEIASLEEVTNASFSHRFIADKVDELLAEANRKGERCEFIIKVISYNV